MKNTSSLNRDFDIKVEMTVKVMPRECPSGVAEKIMWDGVENELDCEAKILGKSLEEYFETKAQLIINYKTKYGRN